MAVFFLSNSAFVVVDGTGTVNAGRGMFVRWPAVVEPMEPLATQTVLLELMPPEEVATLRKTRTVDDVVLASLAIIEILSITAPSLLEQSTSSVQPPPLTVLKLVDVVKHAVPPIVAKECNGRSTSSGILLDEVVATLDLSICFDCIENQALPGQHDCCIRQGVRRAVALNP